MTLIQMVQEARQVAREKGWPFSEFEIAQLIEWSGSQTVEEAVDILRCEVDLRKAEGGRIEA